MIDIISLNYLLAYTEEDTGGLLPNIEGHIVNMDGCVFEANEQIMKFETHFIKGITGGFTEE